MYNLFLDDVRTPENAYSYTLDERYRKLKWVTVRNFADFTVCVKHNGVPELVSFDHDLDSEHYTHNTSSIPYDDFEEETGYHCAQWLFDYCKKNKEKLPAYTCHTLNKIGEENIRDLLNSF